MKYLEKKRFFTFSIKLKKSREMITKISENYNIHKTGQHPKIIT
jgi:hypothetical protein